MRYDQHAYFSWAIPGATLHIITGSLSKDGKCSIIAAVP